MCGRTTPSSKVDFRQARVRRELLDKQHLHLCPVREIRINSSDDQVWLSHSLLTEFCILGLVQYRNVRHRHVRFEKRRVW